MPRDLTINRSHAVDRVRADYPHVGLYDVHMRRIWIAKKKWGQDPLQTSHAKLIVGGSQNTAAVEKDRFLCFWFHTPRSGEGAVHGQHLDWNEGHLMVRLDPYWDYFNQRFLQATETAYIEKNTDLQYRWGRRIFHEYLTANPKFVVNWHMVGPRVEHSMFHIERAEPGK